MSHASELGPEAELALARAEIRDLQRTVMALRLALEQASEKNRALLASVEAGAAGEIAAENYRRRLAGGT